MLAKIKLAALAAIALGCATSAYAGPVQDLNGNTETVLVPTAGLDIGTHQGAKIALTRVQAAAAKICGVRPNERDLGASAAYRSCVKSTTDRAVATANSPLITALNSPARPTQLAAAKP
ncbi:MAG: UrcA family protein [Pseudomonadota bacterium]|uniref:UrcA family protein n=1 Tax=Phenylobacterium sp. TaxID=1871053 RepID=UPI0025EA3FCE|nr:UrcA family protein [Phenylobacterium sp.]MBT9470177.1 UrcA family protein [Phenylobacterium sp.]